ncbi:MAG: 2-hydroxyacyl-CoA dehydratase, partial [Chloroflexi bacterium]|nr:2-hydroxyacyl-CoA dehydratase [Chloroflexota bacterium]
MERFRAVVENRHQYARDWKARTNGKVMGYLCPTMPEELIYAAGVLPVRLLSRYEPDDVSERYLPPGACPNSRNILLQLAKGRYDYLDGVGCSWGCDWLRHTFSSWQIHGNTPYNYNIFVPVFAQGRQAKTLLQGELEIFKESLEEWTGNTVTEQALD